MNASFANPTTGKVNTTSAEKALNNQTGGEIIIDYNGSPVLSAYAPLKFPGLNWAIIAEIDEAEAVASRNHILLISAGIVFAAAMACILVAFRVTRMVINPLGGEPAFMQEIADRIASGDLTIQFDQKNSSGVYGSMLAVTENLKELVNEIRNGAQVQSQHHRSWPLFPNRLPSRCRNKPPIWNKLPLPYRK